MDEQLTTISAEKMLHVGKSVSTRLCLLWWEISSLSSLHCVLVVVVSLTDMSTDINTRVGQFCTILKNSEH